MNILITILKNFCHFGHKLKTKQLFWPFLIRTLAISYRKSSGNPDFTDDYGDQARLLSVMHLFGVRRICFGH